FEGYLASRLADATQALCDADAREVDRQLAGKLAAGRVDVNDPKNVRDACRRLVLKVNPDAAATKARIARCERKVQLVPGEDTMSRIIGDLPAEVAASAYARVDRIARRLRNNGDERTLDQLRADVFGSLLTGATHGDTEPGSADAAGSAGAMVYLHMPIDTALAMSDDGAELTGYGPIPGPIARDIMTRKHSILRKLLVDPGTGKIEGLGRRRYRLTQALRDLITARDRECNWCHRPAQFCDIDHEAEWAKDHGTTDPTNLNAKCEKEHYLKNADGWHLHVDVDTGTATITTPAGRTYTRHRNPIIEPQPPPEPPPPRAHEPPEPANDDPPF
ncbi:MAG: DUF222 domain-containing protein, partial [Actinophytocola sp.]|nr:DUF222 domain-containing protein [Actinophytocola sp.]